MHSNARHLNVIFPWGNATVYPHTSAPARCSSPLCDAMMLCFNKLTGEAASENRVALMAKVSSAGNSVEPQSLSCAVDVTPGDVGGGPLGSTVLIEQIKRAGALTEVNDRIDRSGLLRLLNQYQRHAVCTCVCSQNTNRPSACRHRPSMPISRSLSRAHTPRSGWVSDGELGRGLRMPL